MNGIIRNDVGGALLGFARMLSEFKLPEFKDPNTGATSSFPSFAGAK